MLFGMMFDIFLNAFVLCGLLYFIARHEADFEFAKVAFVPAFISLGNIALPGLLFLCLLDRGLPPEVAFSIWALGSLALMMAFFVFMIMKFCWVPFLKALLVLVLFMAFSTGYNFIRAKLSGDRGNNLVNNARQLLGAKPAETQAQLDPETAHLIKDMDDMVASAMRAAFPTSAAARAAGPAPVPPTAEEPEPEPEPPPMAENHAEETEPALAAVESTPPAAAELSADWRQSRELIRVSGAVARGKGRPSILVNGQVIHPGETITVQHNGRPYRWRLEENLDNGLRWTPAP